MKLVGLTTISFGLVLSIFEWLHDFKINGWSWMVVYSAIVLLERIHHNSQTRNMLKQIGDKVGVEWNADKLNFYENMDSLQLKQLRKVIFPALFAMLFTRRKVTDKSILSKETKTMKLFTSPWSKKLFAFLLLVLVNGLNDTLGLHLSAEAITRITNLGGTYIIAQAGVDSIKPIILYIVSLIGNKSDPAISSDPNKFITP